MEKEPKPQISKLGLHTGRSQAWLQPLWVRLLLIGIIAVWGIVELVHGAYPWAILAGFIGAYAVWGYLIAWNKSSPEDG